MSITIEGPSKKARLRAEKANMKMLLSAVLSAGPKAIHVFIDDNLDAIEAHRARAGQKPLHETLDETIAALTGKDKKAATAARDSLRAAAANFAEKSGLSFMDIQHTVLGLKPLTPEEVQQSIDYNAAHDRLSGQHFMASLKTFAGTPMRMARPAALGLGKLLMGGAYLAASPLIGYHMFTKGTMHAFRGFAHKRRWNSAKRMAVLAAPLAMFGAYVNIPQPAGPYAAMFAGDKLTADAFNAACRDPRVLNNGRLTAAFAVALHSDKKVQNLHYLSALEGLSGGISPVAHYFVSAKETNGFRDVIANNSSASGPYQSILSTKLLWLSQYAKDTPTYQTAKARAGSDPQSRAFVDSIDTLVADFRKNPEGVRQDFKKGRVNLAYQTAVNAANEPIFAGQIMTAELQSVAPYLSVDNLDGKSMKEVVQLIGRYYQGHLLGGEGAAFLRYLNANAPETRMNNSGELARLYKKFRPGNAGKANYYANYYSENVAPENTGVFPKGGNVTAKQFSGQIVSFVERWAEPLADKVAVALQRGDNPYAICLKDPALLNGLVPETTTTAELTRMAVTAKMREYIPEQIRTPVANVTGAAWTATATMASDVWTAGVASVFGKTAEPAVESPTSIEDIINQTAAKAPARGVKASPAG